MRLGIAKKIAFTLSVGYLLSRILQKLNVDDKIPRLAFVILVDVITLLTWEAFYGDPCNRNSKALGDTDIEDPDIKLLLDIENHIHADVKKCKTKVMGPHWCQIYGVRLFDKEWCDALVRVSERYGDWDTKGKGDGYSAGMTLPLDFVPKLQQAYSNAVKKYIFPCTSKLFPTFKPTHHDEVYILRYIAGKEDQEGMDSHYDSEPLACILSLNDEFTGGGTHFPQFKLTVVAEPGVMLLYPGGLSHLHGGKKITSGKRYVILHALYDKVLNGECVSVWEEGEPQHDRDTPPSKG